MFKRILNVSLFIKLMCLVFTVICILTTSIMLTVNHQAREAFTTQALRKLDADKKSLDEILRQKGEEMRKVAVITAGRPNVQKCLKEKDYIKLKEFAISTAKTMHIDLFSITDDKGIVIIRTHSDKVGDDVSSLSGVHDALNGKSYVGYDTSITVPILYNATIPVYDIDDPSKLLGVFVLGYDLSKPELADSIKAITGDEITFFKGDVRISTTLMKDDGTRLINTKITDQEVIEPVINQQKLLIKPIKLFNKPYYGSYIPITMGDNQLLGMTFMGMAAPELKAKYHGWRAGKNFGKTVGSAFDGDNDKAEKPGEKTAEHMGKMVAARNSKLNIARYLTKDRRAEGKMFNP